MSVNIRKLSKVCFLIKWLFYTVVLTFFCMPNKNKKNHTIFLETIDFLKFAGLLKGITLIKFCQYYTQ